MESLDYQFFFRYFKNFRTFDAKAFDLALQHLNNYANEYGLSEEDLILVTKVSFKQELGVTRLRKVIKCLIPRCTVPEEAIEHVLNWILENYNKKISPFAKKAVLQWFIGLIQYNIINPEIINIYYHLFWYFLPYEIINASACNLIYALTKPSDVNRFYVKKLLKTHEKFHQPKYTGAVLLLFKSYRPDCVPEYIPTYAVDKAFGTLPEFFTKFSRAQENLERNNLIPKEIGDICWYNKITKNVRKNAVILIPNIIETEMQKSDGTNTLTSITDSKDLKKYLLQGNVPNNVLCLLNNTESRFILIFSDKNIHERFSFQVYYTLHNAFIERNPQVSYQEKNNLLEKLSILQNTIQQGIPVVSKFLALFLITWDGIEHETYVYSLLEWVNFQSFTELKECVLNYLYDLFISGTVEVKCKILHTITQLAVNIINTYFNRIENKNPFIFLDLKINWDFNEIISSLYEYIITLCKLAWVLENGHSLILHSIMKTNYMLIITEENYDMNVWNLKFLSTIGLFTNSPTCFLRLFKLFNRFPERLNKHIKADYVNSLFNVDAFAVKNKKSIFNIFTEKQKIKLEKELKRLDNVLSCERHLALACYNYKYFKNEDSVKKVYENFIQHGNENYPDLMIFLVNNV